MKLFPYQQDKPYYGAFAAQIYDLILSTVLSIEPFTKKDEIIQTAMFLFHAHARITGYAYFDRFVLAQASILLASKMNDQIVYGQDIVTNFRGKLRALRNRDGNDSEAKTKTQARKVMEMEIALMLNLNFDLNIHTGMAHLKEWGKGIGDSSFYEQVAKTITKLYQTSLVVYFQPQDIALCGLSMAVKEAGLTPELCQWKPTFYSYFIGRKSNIEEIHNEYSSRLSLNNG